MSPHRAAYTVSCIKPQMRARPDIRPAIHNVGIKPKLRAFTDIDALNHYTLTPQTRAHPDIGPSRISKINGLASAAEAGSCKKCRVTRKYYVKRTPSFTGTTPTASACCCMSSKETAPTTVLPSSSSVRAPRAYALWAWKETEKDTETEITIVPPRRPAAGINEKRGSHHEHRHRRR
jgi:hypothetical protein